MKTHRTVILKGVKDTIRILLLMGLTPLLALSAAQAEESSFGEPAAEIPAAETAPLPVVDYSGDAAMDSLIQTEVAGSEGEQRLNDLAEQVFAETPTEQAGGEQAAQTTDATAVQAANLQQAALQLLQNGSLDAAKLAYGAPVEGGSGSDPASFLHAFQSSAMEGLRGIQAEMPVGAFQNFDFAKVQENFSSMMNTIMERMTTDPNAPAGPPTGGEFPGPGGFGPPPPGADMPRDMSGPGETPLFNPGMMIQFANMAFAVAYNDGDAGKFETGFTEFVGALEARQQEFFANHPNPGEGLPAGPFPGMPEGFNPNPAAMMGMGPMPGMEGMMAAMPAGMPMFAGAMPPGMTEGMQNMPMDPSAFLAAGVDPATLATITNDIARQIVGDLILNNINPIPLQDLPPEALNLVFALNANFGPADLTFLQNNPGIDIDREFSAEVVADSYEGQSYEGQEHIHVVYSLDSDGDSLNPLPHVDAEVTAIHNAVHTQSVVLDTEGADHIPGIVA